jgi:hypothetical protein
MNLFDDASAGQWNNPEKYLCGSWNSDIVQTVTLHKATE